MQIDPTWNEPKQARSRQTFELILNTSASLFVNHGYPATTTNLIAAASEISVSTLYHFFPNKEAILHALVHRYQQRVASVFPEEFDLSRPYEAVLGEVVDQILVLEAKEVGFQYILTMVDEPIIQLMHEVLVVQVTNLIGAYHPQLPKEKARLCATVGVAIVRGMLPLTQAPYNFTEKQTGTEIKLALLSYLDAFLAREAN